MICNSTTSKNPHQFLLHKTKQPVIPMASNIKNLTVVSCKPMHKDSDVSKPVVGYKTKLQWTDTVSVATAFGTSSRKAQETYYMDLEAPCEIGFSADLDLDAFEIVEREFTIPAGEKNAGTTMMLKHLVIRK